MADPCSGPLSQRSRAPVDEQTKVTAGAGVEQQDAADITTAVAAAAAAAAVSPCVEALLRLTSGGSATIADLKRNSVGIPDEFFHADRGDEDDGRGGGGGKGKNRDGSGGGGSTAAAATGDSSRYQPLMFDFRYLKSPHEYEEHLRRSVPASELSDLESDYVASYREALVGHYVLLERVYLYQRDLNRFVSDLSAGLYVPHTLESLLLEEDVVWGGGGGGGGGGEGGATGGGGDSAREGRQLLCEAVYIYGILLLMMERHYPGYVRERLIVAFLRYCGRESDVDRSNVDAVCRLCRDTGAVAYFAGGTKTSSTSSSTLGRFLWGSGNADQEKKTKSSSATPTPTQKLFARFPLPPDLIRNAIGRLVVDDLYGMSRIFPNLNHRSTRLARQAAMLYVILYFRPEALHDEGGTMREIVDKFFGDNWVLALPNSGGASGMVVDLQREWGDYDAARGALGGNGVLTSDSVERLHLSNADAFHECLGEIRGHLDHAGGGGGAVGGGGGGALGDDAFVLERADELLNLARRCNVELRWRLLHRRATDEAFARVICATGGESSSLTSLLSPGSSSSAASAASASTERGVVSDAGVVSMLLNLSQLEIRLKESFTRLLDKKSETWDECRSEARGRLAELGEYFSGRQRALARGVVARDGGLVDWFSSVAERVGALSYGHGEHVAVTGRKIQQLLKALEDVERFDAVDADPQVKASLGDVRSLLLRMVRTISIQREVTSVLKAVSDMSYGWSTVGDYVDVIHARIAADPTSATLLHAFFFKLVSVVDEPMLRMRQCHHAELSTVSEYYAGEVVAFVRTVVDVIPSSVFKILTQIADITERRLKQPPIKIEVGSIQDYAQSDVRFELAKLTHKVSILYRAILIMEKKGSGNIELHPRRILEDGLRKELVRKVAEALHQNLQFQVAANADVEALISCRNSTIRSLASLGSRMEGFRKSLEYIQDYVGVAGLKIWVEEFSRIIDFNVEQEGSKYLRKKGFDFQSSLQSTGAPIPTFSRTQTEPLCINFMGRTMSALLRMTDAQSTIYSLECGGWFLADGIEMCGIATFSFMSNAIGVAGLRGLDRLLSFRIMHELRRFFAFYRNTVKQSAVLLEQIRDGLFPEWKNCEDAEQFYALARRKTEKLTVPLLTCLRRIGQAQLIRKMIRSELQMRSRVEANALHKAAATLDAALLHDIRAKSCQGDAGSLTKEHILECDQVSPVLEAIGAGDPMATVFLETDPLEGLPVLLLMFILSNISKFKYDTNFGSLVRAKEGYPLDGWPIVAGTATLLKQFHPSYAKSTLAYVGQFVRSTLENIGSHPESTKLDDATVPSDVRNTIVFACQLCSISNVPRANLFEFVPQCLLELCMFS